MNGIYEFKDGMWKVDENIDRIKRFHSHLEKIENAINETLKKPTEKIFDYDWSIFKNYEPTINYKSTTDLIKPLPQDFSLFEIILGDVDYQSILSTYSKMIIIIVLLYIVVKLCKYKNKEISEINNLFKDVGFRNSKEKYAYVKYVKKYESYNLYRIIIPKGCSVIGLYKLLPAFENLFSNDVDVYEVDNEYFLKVFTKKLKKVENYPFQVVDIKDKSTLTLVVGHSLDGILRIDLTKYVNLLLVGCTGSGKSKLLSSIILNLMEYENVEIVYLDNKGGTESSKFSKYIETTKSIRESIEKLFSIRKEIDERLKILRNNNCDNIIDYNKKNNNKMKFKVVIIDEIFGFLLQKNKNQIYGMLAETLSICRSSGVHFIISTQRCTTDILPTIISTHMPSRICLKTSSKQESINVINKEGMEEINEVGRGVLYTNGDLTPFQSMYLTSDEIIKILHKRGTKYNTNEYNNIEGTRDIFNNIIGDD